MQVARLRIEEQQPGDDLPQRLTRLQIGERPDPIGRVVMLGQLVKVQDRTVVLSDRESACTVRMWEQERGVTVAFNGCQARCSGDAFSYLWPILIDRRSGRCA